MAESREPQFLIDTSIFIALEQSRPLGALPEAGRWFVSPVTLGELKHGMLVAVDPATRARRTDTWIEAARMDCLEIDDAVGNTWGEYAAIAVSNGRRISASDGLIAATAATYGVTLVTQDHGFAWYPDLSVLVV